MENLKFICEKDMERFDYYIEKADNKASFILAFAGIFIGVLLFQNDTFFSKINESLLFCFKVIYLFCIIFLSFTSYFSFKALSPRLPKKDDRKSVFYFEDIKYMSEQEFINKVNDDVIMKDMYFQIKDLAIICSEKMKNIKISIICLKASVLMAVILFLIKFLF